MKAKCLLLCFAVSLTAARAQENFGKFAEYPQGEFILQEPRPVFRLTKDFVFQDENEIEWIAPKGESIDGASIPQPAWSFIGGPFEGRYLYAAIVHDYFSCSKSQDFDETQDIFWRAMRSVGVDSFKAWYMWAAVRFLGLPRWKVDPANPVASPCRTPDSTTATIFDQMDEEGKERAVAKLTAIKRTLETSNGTAIDVVDGEVVEAGSQQAELLMDRLLEAAQENFVLRQAVINDLGLVTIPTDAELANPNLVQPWGKGDVLELDRYLESRGLPADYAPIEQPKYDMKEIDVLAPRLEFLDIEKAYEFSR